MDAPTPTTSPHRWIQAKRAGGGGSLPPLTTQFDWRPQRLGPNPPEAMVRVADAAFSRMVAAAAPA